MQEDGFNRDDVLAELNSLREQNKKLAGHTNLKQRIHHVSKLKEEVRAWSLLGAVWVDGCVSPTAAF